MTELQGKLPYDTILFAVRRIIKEPDAFLEIQFSGLTVHVYPSRVSIEDQHQKMKLFASFMIALAEEVESLPTRFAFWHDTQGLRIGVLRGVMLDDSQVNEIIWMPAEIIAVNRAAMSAPASARFPFLDEDGNEIEPTMFRRIRL